MALLGDLVVKIVGDTAGFIRAVDKSGRKMSQFERDMKKITRSMANTGRKLTMAVTLPILGIAAAAIKTAGDFQTSMNRVRALTGATGADFQELEAAARELGATTQFSAKEAAEGMGFLSMAGFEANEIISAMPATLNLAAAAQIDMGQAADIASNILSGFNLDADKLSGAIDIMALTFTSSNTDLVQLGEAMSMVAPISQGLGVSMEETAAAIGILSNSGIQASRAGTGLRKILTTLVTEADRLGVVTKDASGEMRPLADILDDLTAAGLSAEDALEIFGDRAGPAITVLLAQGGDALRDFTEELENAGGTAENIANIQMEGLNGALKRFKSVAQEAGIVIGNDLMPVVMDILETTQGWIEAFNRLDEETRKIILIVGGLAAALGPLLIVLSKLPGIIKGIKAGLTALAAPPAGTIFLAIAAAGLLALAIVKLIRRQKEHIALLYDTKNAIELLTREEQEAARGRLIALKVEAGAQLRKSRDVVAGIREEREAMLAAAAATGAWSPKLAYLNQQWDLHNGIIDRTTEELVDITTALLVIEDEWEAERNALQTNTEMFGNYNVILSETEEGVDDLTGSVGLLAEAFGELSGQVIKAGWTIGEDFGPVFDEAFGPDGKWKKHLKDLATYHATVLPTMVEMERRAAMELIAGWGEVYSFRKMETEALIEYIAFALPTMVEMERRAAMETIAAWGEVYEYHETAQEEQQTQLEQFLDWYKENYIRSIIDATQGLVSALVDLTTTRMDAEIAAVEASLLSEEQKDAKIRAIKRDQAAREKRLGIFNATIDTAQAIIGFLADPGSWEGLVLSVLAGATGAAQIAAIKAAPLPALAAGGIVTAPTPAIVGEAGPEIIFPLDQLSDFLAGRGDFDGGSTGDSTVIVNLDGGQILKYVGKASDDGRLLINQRAVV